MHTEPQIFGEASHFRHQFIDDFNVVVIAVVSRWQHALFVSACAWHSPGMVYAFMLLEANKS